MQILNTRDMKIIKRKKNKNRSFLIFGKHAVDAALKNKHRRKIKLFITRALAKEYKAYEAIVELDICEHKEISKKFLNDVVHQGIALEVLPLEQESLEQLKCICKERSRIVILDQVTDPHNIGAILRSAAAFDVDAIIVTKDNAPDESGTIAKSASGALEVIPIIKVTNLAATMKYLKEKGYWCIGLDGAAKQNISQITPPEKCVIVLGAESGMRRLTKDNCDHLVKIPMSNNVESLNVSVAAAITMASLYPTPSR
jgi:23S rRNA (guanosine2251-2'-O)-methyltransferase